MAGAVIGEVVGGALFEEGLRRLFDWGGRAINFPTLREDLRVTVQRLTPLILQIKSSYERSNLPLDQIELLLKELQDSDEAVRKYSNVPCWKSIPCFSPHDNIQERTKKLERAITVEMQVSMARDVNEILSTLLSLKEIMLTLADNSCSGQTSSGTVIKVLHGPPEKPKFTVGLDWLLKTTKSKLLNGVELVLVLTGLPGSGKTTIAIELCWDPDVKEKFGGNIFFVIVPKTPDLKNIVQTIFGYCGCPAPEFSSDEDAINRLGVLLRNFGGRPILLVLDDVRQGSETLVEKFKFQIPNYKILVTSRVTFPRYTSCPIEPIGHDDAMTLFHHSSLLDDGSLYKHPENLVDEVVRSCKGLPLVIKVIARSLGQQPHETWQKIVKEWWQGHSILDSNSNLLNFLQESSCVLADESNVKECFKDLGLFPEDQRIPVTALIDMWAELYRLDDDGKEAMAIINKLVSRNLANIAVTRKTESDTDGYYNNHFVMQHDLLRELAIHQSNQEPFERRKRLMVDINENYRQWRLEEQQAGITARMFSRFRKRCVKQKQQSAIARTLSISTDEAFTSDWGNTQLSGIEVLISNVRKKHPSLLKPIEKMSSLKVLICSNYGFDTSRLENFEPLHSLSSLKRIRLEKFSLPPLGKLKNLQKLSLYMCDTSQAFGSSNIPISDALPNLVELNIDYCKDMVELPSGLCDIKTLRKLSISNCHKFCNLPQEIGRLENLELLRLNSCTDLGGIPESIGWLSRIRFLDISNCINLRNLPESFGNLENIEKLFMTGCSRCELPDSVINLGNLKHVTCDEETAASWEVFKPKLTNLRIEVPHVDVNLSCLPGTSS